jgi:hypothetical protein
MIARDPRNTEEKVRLFRARFSGLEHIYGTYDPGSGRSWQVKQPVTDAVVLDHLRGKRPLGIYLLTGTHTRAVVVDYDTDEPDLPVEFANRAAHYGIDAYIETSKRKGFHVWMFFESEGVSAAKARAVARHIVEEAGHKAEVFPKQDVIDLSQGYGNFINLPLFAPLVIQGRTVFVDPKNGLRPVPNQWQYIEQMKFVQEFLLDEIIEVNEIRVGSPEIREVPRSLGTFQPAWALPPCVRRMFEEGVSENQRVSCFRLAVHLRRIGLPFDVVVAALQQWATKNRPQQGKRVIARDEIKAQAAAAFLKDYRGSGCEDPAVNAYCDESCRVFQRRGNPTPATTETTTCIPPP